MARKKLPLNQLKTKRINLWLTKDEYQSLLLLAETSALHLNDWLRKYIFSRQFPPAKMSPLTKESIMELNKIGVNLNQLTKLANASKEYSTGLISVAQDLEVKIKELKSLILNYDSKTN